MSLTEQEQADAFALAILSGLATADQAMDWARDLMLTLADPPVELVELAGAIRPHPLDIVRLLRNFRGSETTSACSGLFSPLTAPRFLMRLLLNGGTLAGRTTGRSMLLAHHRELVADLREPTPEDPWRVLVSGCLNGWQCGVDSTDNGLGASLSQLLCLPTFRAVPFCPEQHALGTPRTTPDIHGGDGFDVIAGRAMVLDERGDDVTDKMLSGARAMVDLAVAARAELAILTDMSAACGSQVISSGCRLTLPRHYQKGVGLASAMLLDAGVPLVSQRDFHTLALLRARLEPGYVVPAALRDHHEQDWTRQNLPHRHPRA